MKYQQTWEGRAVSDDQRLIALFGAGQAAVPVLHAPGNKAAHPMGLGILLYALDDEGESPRLIMEVAPTASEPGRFEAPPMFGGAWNLTCATCSTRLSKKESELFEKVCKALVARRSGVKRQNHTVLVA